MIIGTAGHVDHGKTALIGRLTGTDTDRLPEERRRGMTIDLGYAYVALPDGRRLGFIDVPGHEDFLPNMLSGVGGIDHALLVVAADDGIMPQTREHLAILHLLGIGSATVALSKIDLVPAERVGALAARIDALLAPTALAGSPVFPVSSHSGEGVAALAEHLAGLAEPAPCADERPFRLAIDRAFTVTGAGLVVTGTALSGRVRQGDTLWLSGADRPVRVRGLHAQNLACDSGTAHQRLALNLAGNVGKDDIRRGDWLLGNAPPALGQRVTVELKTHPELARPLGHWMPVHLHHGARRVTGHLSLLEGGPVGAGARALAELDLDAPLLLADNDRLIVRDASAQSTLAGARVLELSPPARAKRHPDRLAYLDALSRAAGDDAALALQLGQHGAVFLPAFAWARQRLPASLPRLAGWDALRRVGGDEGWGYAPAAWQAIKDTLLARLERLHAEQPDLLGLGRAHLRRLALPKEPVDAVDAAIAELLAQGGLRHTRGWLHLPQHQLAFTEAEAAVWLRVEALLEHKAEAQWVLDLARELDEPAELVKALMRKAARLGHVTAIVPERYCANATIERLANAVRTLANETGYVEAAALRDAIGGGRKVAIQILEFFDRSGFTRRLGNRHWLRDSSLFT